MPSKLILLSPMIGVSPAARLAWWISRLGVVPYFEKANWLDVLPEYNPFKYNSFAANAGFQTASLTRAVQTDLARVADECPACRDPSDSHVPVDSRCDGQYPAVVHPLYDQLPANGSELVLFDVNHLSGIDVFVRASDRSLVGSLLDRTARRYRRVVVTNGSPDTRMSRLRRSNPIRSALRDGRWDWPGRPRCSR